MDATMNTAQLFDRYEAILGLRNATPDRETWLQLDREVQKAWCEWKAAFERATMRDDPAIYTIEQGGIR